MSLVLKDKLLFKAMLTTFYSFGNLNVQFLSISLGNLAALQAPQYFMP